MAMDISFNGGRFVSCPNGINYQEVLDDFSNTSIIRIMTYNISAKDDQDALLERLNTVDGNTNIKVITNIPSRFPVYYQSKAGEYMRNKAHDNIEIYLKKLSPSSFDASFAPYFNFTNHAKIIGTENIVYIGSANYSNESRYNIETGVLITDIDFIKKLYSEFFEKVIEKSIPYFDDDFQVLRLLTFSLLVKFNIHKEKLLNYVYRFNPNTKKYCFIKEETFFSDDDLTELVADLMDFQGLDVRAENTYSEDDEDYNEKVDEIVEAHNSIDVNWLVNISSTDDIMYNYINFNADQEAMDIFEREYYSEGYDEYLDTYMQMAMDDAQDLFNDLVCEVNAIADKYLNNITEIIHVLEMTNALINKYAESRISTKIDNTYEKI